MVGTLIESRHRAPRRAGGATLSVAVHSVVISAAMLAGARAAPARLTRAALIPVQLRPPRTAAPAHTAAPPARSNAHPTIRVPMIDVATIAFNHAPTNVPSIAIPVASPGTIDIAPTEAGFASVLGASGSGDASAGGNDDAPWRGGELLMHIVRSSTPHYPDVLRQAGIDGHVLVRFVVDTNGRVDPRNVQVLESTNELFTASVRAALPNFRFTPSVIRGHRVAATAEMPFEFTIRP